MQTINGCKRSSTFRHELFVLNGLLHQRGIVIPGHAFRAQSGQANWTRLYASIAFF